MKGRKTLRRAGIVLAFGALLSAGMLASGAMGMVSGITPEKAAETAAMASNQGLYNGFLVIALALGLVAPDATVSASFALYGLICVAIAGIWGGITVSKRIVFVQTVPALVALGLGWFA
jgi:putative membrane protein